MDVIYEKIATQKARRRIHLLKDSLVAGNVRTYLEMQYVV